MAALLQGSSDHPVRDLVRSEVEDGWHRFDRMMEDSEWLGSGPHGSAMEFTQWDGIKRAATDAANAGRKDVQVLRSRASQALTDPYPSISTPALSRDASLHSRFAKQYLAYAARDTREAARQAGIAGREAFEVGRRTAVGEGGTHADPKTAKPSVFKRLEPYLMGPNGYPTNAAIVAADAVLLDLGVGMGIGLAAEGRKREKREKEREERALAGRRM